MEVPGWGVEIELLLPACAKATAMHSPSCLCDLDSFTQDKNDENYEDSFSATLEGEISHHLRGPGPKHFPIKDLWLKIMI